MIMWRDSVRGDARRNECQGKERVLYCQFGKFDNKFDIFLFSTISRIVLCWVHGFGDVYDCTHRARPKTSYLTLIKSIYATVR
jgi:hypothetical protein